MKVLITGGNGQLGRAFSAIWPDATIIDRGDLDLTAPNDVIRLAIEKYSPHVLINCAAYTAVDKAETEGDKAMQINGTSVDSMVLACNLLGAWFIQVSTDYVLSPAYAGVRQVNEKPAPDSQYGRSKLKGEEAALNYARGRVIRTSWVFGDGNNFVKTISELGKTKSEIGVVSDQVGRPTYAPDLAYAIKQLVQAHIEKLPSIIHIQNEGPVVSWADFARQILLTVGSRAIVNDLTTHEFAADKSPFAHRPLSSIFDLNSLHEFGVTMPDWRESLVKYLSQPTH